MNTPAHLILGAAAMGRPGLRGTLAAGILGGLAPDLSLYVMASVSLIVLQIPPQVVFDELYFSDAWQTVFAIDNSVFLWAGLLALGAWRRWILLIAFAGAGLLHVALDFPLHHDDGRPHFWPLSDWVFESPVSYWDMAQGAGIIAPLEGLIAVIAAALVWLRFPSWQTRAGMLALLAAELWVIRGWFNFVA